MQTLDLKLISEKQKTQYNKLVTHVMQSWEWGEFRESMGIKVLRYGLYADGKLKSAFQLTIHHIPYTNFNVGYLPKGPFTDKNLSEALKKIGKEENCAFIKVEPHIVIASEAKQSSMGPDSTKIATSPLTTLKDPRNDIDGNFHPSPKPLFTKYNFILDLTQSEKDLLKNMHSKTRYNIRLAQKHGVKVEERSDDESFEIYLKLYFETTKRQGYHGHNETYHQKIWDTLKLKNMARILIAFYKDEPLTSWLLLNFKDALYYPYGGSSKIHPEVMANNLICWEAIKLGKKLGLKKFDMWGADFRFGFHKFKQGYGGKLVEYIGTYDLVFNWPVYWAFTIVDKLMPLKVLLLKWISH
ncbi:MAG: FemAB family protein [Microgenomates group bacterium Gr01-1014_93]|nr:MAG: FemAB family protein [Microgenomates group bacterium Gr01-1014_93]